MQFVWYDLGMYPDPSVPILSQTATLFFTISARSPGPKFTTAGNAASIGT
jgi:hypothetical protein